MEQNNTQLKAYLTEDGTPDIYFEAPKNRFWARVSDTEYKQMTERQALQHLNDVYGFSNKRS